MPELQELLAASTSTPTESLTFAEYYQRLQHEPQLARSAHALLRDAVLAKGVTRRPRDPSGPYTAENPRCFGAFSDELFGIDEILEQMMRVIESAAAGQDTRRRILLLIGPPGSAKSTIATILKRSLEAYTRSEAGAVYAIADCPLHEDPLHLLPHDVRAAFTQQTGIPVEGDLCPVCQYRLQHEWQDIAQVRVERIVFSEKGRMGVATCAPSDPNTQDVSDLVGSMDLVALQKYGVESDPRAWRFDGALDVGNRGICEMIEILKHKAELLFTLLTVAQERQIKAGRFALTDCDEVILAHTNEEELVSFQAEGRNAALADRVIKIQVPYNMCWSDEEKIYAKMMARSGVHIAPWTLRVAAAVAILSRCQKIDKYSPATKLRLYNGEYKGEYTAWHADEARRLSPRDGMQGLSPRQVVNAMANTIAGLEHPCLNPIQTMRALRKSHEHHLGHSKPEELDDLVGQVRKEYDAWVKDTVSKAFVTEFDYAAQSMFQKYLDNAYAHLGNEKVKDPITDEWKDADTKFLQELEQAIRVTDSEAKTFREEICRKAGNLARKGETFRWDSHPRLKEAIEKRLFGDLQGTIRTTLSGQVPDEEQRKRLEGVKARLIEQQGCCEYCAAQMLDYCGELLSHA